MYYLLLQLNKLYQRIIISVIIKQNKKSYHTPWNTDLYPKGVRAFLLGNPDLVKQNLPIFVGLKQYKYCNIIIILC